MNCIIPGINLKVLAKALQALSKIGDELFMEAKKDKLSLITLNTAKTVCARFHLFDSFFSCFDVDKKELKPENKETLTCKIHMKVLLPLFKGNLEKKLDFLRIEYESDSDFILFKMRYKCDDILMVHKLRLMDSETLSIGVETDAGSNNMSATSSFFNHLLSMFNTSDDEITLEISKSKVIARNYCLGAPCRPKMMRSQINLNSTEFCSFGIKQETTINFSLKPLRTVIHFADGFNLNIEFSFETGGKPLSLIMHNTTFEVSFIVATLNPCFDGSSTTTTSAVARKIQIYPAEKHPDVTSEDLEALQSENWDSEIAAVNGDTDSRVTDNSFGALLEKARNIGKDVNENDRQVDVVPRSPESPRSKRAKMVFGRCYDPTFNATLLGEVLAQNSDSD